MSTSLGISKIALLTDGVHPLVLGGMQKHSYHLLCSLLKSGVQVILYHPDSKGEIRDHVPESEAELLQEVRIDFKKDKGVPGSYLRRSYAYSAKIADHLEKEEGLDFIYAQGFSAWALLDRKRRGATFPAIGVNFHGLEMFQTPAGFKERLIQWMFKGPVRFNLRHADRVYSLGGGLTQILASIVDKEKIAEIPIALDEAWALSGTKEFTSDPLRVLFIGRYERRKGIEELNEHIRTDAIPGVEYHFVGPIPQSKRLTSPSVHFYGKVMDVDELRRIIDSAHVLIVPSYSEGMPTVILEAMARGLIILASDVGAVSVQVDDSNGRLMQAGSISDIAEDLLYLKSLGETSKRAMSMASINKFKSGFTWPKVIAMMIADIDSTVKNRKAEC